MKSLLEWSAARKLESIRWLQAIILLHEQGPQRISAVTDHVGISVAAGTQLADRLERLGIARRVAIPEDRRVWLLALDEAVSAELKAILPAAA